MNTTETLNCISHKLNIYWGLFMLIFGIIGGLCNILTFRHYSLRINSCCTYMLIGSIVSLIQIMFGLSGRIASEGFDVHWTAKSIVWCKIRYYMAQWASLSALSCLILSAVDRFFSTCRQIKWRHLNSVNTARKICLYIIIFWMLAVIPTLIYAKPIAVSSDKRLCLNSSIIWSKFITYFINLCCHGIFPWFLMSLFTCLTSKNIRQIHNRRIGILPSVNLTRMSRIDDQLSSMLLSQVIICIISSIPYCAQSIYQSFTGTVYKTEYRQAQEYLFIQITHLIFNLNYVSTFYVNYLSSSIFRKVSKQVLINLFKKQEDISRQITLINHQENNTQLILKQKKLKIFTTHGMSSISPI